MEKDYMLLASEPATDESDDADTIPPAPPTSERGRSGEHKRVPAPRETLATLPDADEDFEHHDTIPAPPWIEEPQDAPKPAG